MSPWLTFVIGVILGLLIGWLIDLFYRRRSTAARFEAVEPRTTPPDWAAPPSAPPAVGVGTLPEADAPPRVGPPTLEAAENQQVSDLPPTPEATAAEAPAVPELPLAAEAPAAPELLLAPEATAPLESPGEPEPMLNAETPIEPATAPLPVAVEPLAALDRSEAANWPEVSSRVTEAAADVPTMPAIEGRVKDELPVAAAGLPPEAIEALASNTVQAATPTRLVSSIERRDKLIVIEGIGPVYEKKLNAAGISTFAQLIEAGEDRLRELIQPQSWQRVNFAEWIEQAQLLAEGKDEELRALQARLFNRKKG